mmetsp:Transcript_8897/g.16725  ORF Transcript_8897/g.16725 Transcript_8897/m.16725 type:complete len:99 (-) Transcript_8897:215-511(-)
MSMLYQCVRFLVCTNINRIRKLKTSFEQQMSVSDRLLFYLFLSRLISVSTKVTQLKTLINVSIKPLCINARDCDRPIGSYYAVFLWQVISIAAKKMQK